MKSIRNMKKDRVLEAMVLPALARGGFKVKQHQNIGKRPSGRSLYADIVAEKEGTKNVISLIWRQVSGPAEQKVPYEIICLVHAIKDSKEYKRAYLVLGGVGWTLRDFYLGNELREYLSYDSELTILSLERFISVANNGKL